MKKKEVVIVAEQIEQKIFIIRKKKVMLDRDLAGLYGVETKVLNQAVKRNKDRFPDDFMFLLTKEEFMSLKSQFVTSSWGGVRKMPQVFTEQGIAMLSSVLNSDQAIQVNIAIVRVFVRLREYLLTHKELLEKVDALENKVGKHDEQIALIFKAIKSMISAPKKQKTRIGFHCD